MSYLVLARKWRPLHFHDVVGQQHVTDTLQKAIEKQRVAHAYIFAGIRGVGKTTVARILARALNCDSGPTPAPCGECVHCKGIISGSGFDVREIDGASNNSVEDIRQLRENVTYSSMDSRNKIIIIDEVHMLTKSAFNALLKTLEEPPPGVVFIFATTEPNKIPETIHSRCQRYDFRRISTERIVAKLQSICENEQVHFEHKALFLIARKAAGSMRDALSLLDQVYSFCSDTLGEAQVRSVLGMVSSDIYDRIIHAFIEKNPEPLLHSVQTILYEGYDISEFIAGLQEHLRLLLFACLPRVLSDTRLELNIESDERREKLKRDASGFSEKILLRMIEVTKQMERECKWSAFPRFIVEVGLLKMAYMDKSLSVEELLKAFGSSNSSIDPLKTPNGSAQDIEKKKSEETITGPVHETSPTELQNKESGASVSPISASAEASTPLNSHEPHRCEPNVSESFMPDPASDNSNPPREVTKNWQAFMDHLMHERPYLGSFLSVAHLTDVSTHTVDIRFAQEHSFQYSQIVKKKNREEISGFMCSFFNQSLELHVNYEEKNDATAPQSGTDKVTEEHEPTSIEQDMEEEPVIKSLLDKFDAEVLS